MKLQTIIILLLSGTLATQAADYKYLTFAKSDGTKESLSAVGLDITFSDNQLTATNGTETAVFSLSEVSRMYFSNDATEVGVLTGDVNGDGSVNILDATSTISYILGQTPESFQEKAADVNGDGKVDIVDVTSIIDIILEKK